MTLRNSTLAAVGALLAVAVVLAIVLSQTTRHAIGSNFVPPQAFVAQVPGGARVCQSREHIPSGTGAIQVRIGTFGRPGPRLELSVAGPTGGTLARRVRTAGWPEGDVAIPVARLGERQGAEVCLRNAGSAPIAVAGGRTLGAAAVVGGQPASGGITLRYLEPEARSWWGFAPEIADRVARLRDAPPGALTLPLFLVLAIGTLAAAVALVLREARR